jgi:nucleotide-binding universal stress UspA family protein
MLVPLDGSPLAETVLAPARTLALALTQPGPAYIHLLLVVPPYGAVREYMPDALLLDGATVYLEQVARGLRSQGDDGALTVTWSVVAQGDIAHGILAAVEMEATSVAGESVPRCGMIAMATHGHSGVARWALGSVTERVLHGTKLPLLIVRPQEVMAAPTTERNTSPLTPDLPRA